jgi:hypothetical protein
MGGVKIKFFEKNKFNINGAPIRVDFQIEFKPCRFILLRLKEKNYFHLGEIKILINSLFESWHPNLFLLGFRPDRFRHTPWL